MTPPCHCPAPDARCLRAGLPMVGRLWELCAGVRCAPERSTAYRRLWDGRRRRPCCHLGDDTGERKVCLPCRGRVELKVFACRHPAHGTTTLRECADCPDFEELP